MRSIGRHGLTTILQCTGTGHVHNSVVLYQHTTHAQLYSVDQAQEPDGVSPTFRFPVPLRQKKNCDFSYAGLKTAVRMAIDAELGEGGGGCRS